MSLYALGLVDDIAEKLRLQLRVRILWSIVIFNSISHRLCLSPGFAKVETVSTARKYESIYPLFPPPNPFTYYEENDIIMERK